MVNGEKVEMTVKVGDTVLTGKYSGTQVKVDGEELTIVRQEDILAVVRISFDCKEEHPLCLR